MPTQSHYTNASGQAVSLPAIGTLAWVVSVRCGPTGSYTVSGGDGFGGATVGGNGWTDFHGSAAAGWAAVVVAPPPLPAVPLDPGTVTLAADRVLVQVGRLKLSNSNRLTLTGTARVLLTDLGTVATSTILGTPKAPRSSFAVPTDYVFDQVYRLALTGGQRATLCGTANLILSDDFARRSRVVLTGRGF